MSDDIDYSAYGMTEEEFRRVDALGKDEILRVLRNVLPNILREFLHRGLIDLKKSSDHDYLWKVFRNHDYLIDEARYNYSIHSDFLNVAEYAINQDKLDVAIVLIVTAIEHMLNLYFSERLMIQGVEAEDITQIIRRNGIEAKVGWLYAFTEKTDFPPKLKSQILELVDIRNSIVHYKSVPLKLNEQSSFDRIKNKLEKLDVDGMCELPADLQDHLEITLDNVDPNRLKAKEMAIIMTNR